MRRGITYCHVSSLDKRLSDEKYPLGSDISTVMAQNAESLRRVGSDVCARAGEVAAAAIAKATPATSRVPAPFARWNNPSATFTLIRSLAPLGMTIWVGGHPNAEGRRPSSLVPRPSSLVPTPPAP